MSVRRTFPSSQFFEPADGEPIRSVVTTTPECVVVAWYLKPGQRINTHRHPCGQDTWTILSGSGEYVISEAGDTTPIQAGDIVIAHTGEVHGLHNNGVEPIYFISVVSPANAGYELLEDY